MYMDFNTKSLRNFGVPKYRDPHRYMDFKTKLEPCAKIRDPHRYMDFNKKVAELWGILFKRFFLS